VKTLYSLLNNKKFRWSRDVLSFFKNKGSTATDILANNDLDYAYSDIILSACDDMSTLFSMRKCAATHTFFFHVTIRSPQACRYFHDYKLITDSFNYP
jgi:hypothetical protein